MKKILEGESAGRCLEERMRESEAGGRVVVQGVVSSGSCRVVGDRGSAVRDFLSVL